MSGLSYQRCFNHAQREAVACCPSCRRFYCRECVVEHDDRMLCATCLRAGAGEPNRARRSVSFLRRMAQSIIAILCAWFFFYLIGEVLLAIPTSFHDGTIWSDSTGEDAE